MGQKIDQLAIFLFLVPCFSSLPKAGLIGENEN